MIDDRFKRLTLLLGESAVRDLTTKTVLILGVGGVGGFVVEALARSAIGTLILVDYDKIDVTNINRQIIALDSTIGKKKIDVLEERIKDIHPKCNVIKIDQFIDENNYFELFNYKIDFFADCCDSIKTKKCIIKYALEHNIPLISSMGVGNRMDPMKLEVTDIKKTSGDPIARIIRKYLKEEKIHKRFFVLCSREVPRKHGDIIATSIFTPAISGLLIANHIIKELNK